MCLLRYMDEGLWSVDLDVFVSLKKIEALLMFDSNVSENCCIFHNVNTPRPRSGFRQAAQQGASGYH